MKHFLICALALVASVLARAADNETVLENAGAEEVIAHATEMRVVRLDRHKLTRAQQDEFRGRLNAAGDDRDKEWARQLKIEYQPGGEPVVLTADQVKWMKSALLAEASYTPRETSTLCDFMPVIRLTIRSPKGEVDALFCFWCATLMLESDGALKGGRLFKPAKPEWIAFWQRVMPSDEVIAKLRP